MAQVEVMFARFPGNMSEHPDSSDWFAKTLLIASKDNRIAHIHTARISDTPITMGRNFILELAKKRGVDYVVMIDSDMSPDMYVGADPQAKPFWETAFDFLLDLGKPAMIAVPYCGPPPHENIYVFRWGSKQSDHPNVDFSLDQFTREDTVELHGIQEVAALPTGLCIIDCAALECIKPPYFYYEWKDGTESEKASTEDVTFSRDLSLAGVPVYCAWDCWAGHWKMKRVGRPVPLHPRMMAKKFKEVVLEEAGKVNEQNGPSEKQQATDSPPPVQVKRVGVPLPRSVACETLQ